tara:strand:+ start:1539 stop:1811 length:273 start_codon:yes stop_codon:yes gene_type:complete
VLITDQPPFFQFAGKTGVLSVQLYCGTLSSNRKVVSPGSGVVSFGISFGPESSLQPVVKPQKTKIPHKIMALIENRMFMIVLFINEKKRE